jgi:hypothetical protein
MFPCVAPIERSSLYAFAFTHPWLLLLLYLILALLSSCPLLSAIVDAVLSWLDRIYPKDRLDTSGRKLYTRNSHSRRSFRCTSKHGDDDITELN